MIPNIIGFHANDAIKFTDPIKDDCFIMASDTKWFGNGMYFWDNLSNANYWVRKKLRESEIECVYIISANIIINQLLDLTDYDIIDKIERIWINYCKLKKIVDYKHIPVGVRLNILFDFFPDIRNEYKVIKGIGFYKNSKQHHFYVYDAAHNENIPYITSQIKTIYCVKCPTKIIDVKKVTELKK
jgi:hypothetical protein